MRGAVLISILSVLAFASPAHCDDWDAALLPFAVNVHRTPMQTWGPGYGIYLGGGYFLTAAHVAGRGWMTRPKIAIAGREFPTTVVKEGSFEETDLTLLAVDENLLPARLGLRRTVLCGGDPVPGQPVVTVVPEGVARSRILPAAALPADVQRFKTVIVDVATTGNSGSGVFDAEHQCLLGIMSRKISLKKESRGPARPETRDIAKYFVPATEISGFLPANIIRTQ